MPRFRDPVHGFIDITDLEQKIIDSYPFQRLRNIRQLATTYLVYHGAEHTRFGHSIGVMHLVTRAFEAVVKNNKNLFRDNPKENEAVIMWYKQILRLIALTHDLGHAPFSHASTELFPNKLEHEDYTKLIIETTEVSAIINEIGTSLHQDIAENLGVTANDLINKYNIRPITPQLLWMIYGEEPRIPSDDGNNEYIWPDFVFLKSFMDSELDCDKMDYLLRDSLYCGVTYGQYDLNRFIAMLTLFKTEEKAMQLAISSGGIQAFEEFVLARYFMFIQVYFHRTRRYFDRLLVDCLKEILPEGKYPENVSEYLKWDDVSVISKMREKGKMFSQKYLQRKTMTCIRESSAHATKDESRLFEVLQKQINDEFGKDATFFDEIDKNAHGLLPATFSREDDSGKEIKIIDQYTGKTENIMEVSLILQGIIKKISICRIYADNRDVEKHKKIKSRFTELYN
jgi:HD superfamily phosphohydrolase